MTIHELYGKLAEAYEIEATAHRRTLSVLADVKAGRITLDRLEADGSNWKVAPLPEADASETKVNPPAETTAGKGE